MVSSNCNEKGFTLIELMISVAIFSLVVGAAYAVFDSQQKTHNIQQQVVDVQQDLRAGMDFLVREIRMAGYDEPHGDPVGAGFLQATSSTLQMTAAIYNGLDDDADGLVDEWGEAGNHEWDGVDNDGNGTVDGESEAVAMDLLQPAENITFGFENGADANDDGLADAGAARFGRTDGNGQFETLMDNTHAVAFAYAFDRDENGKIDFNDINGDGVQNAGEAVLWAIDSDGDQRLDVQLDGTALGTPVPIDRVRAVNIWLLVRTAFEGRDYLDTRTYTVGNTNITPNDGYRRRLLTTQVICKNMW